MKLYYSPNACSLAIHVLLEEIGGPYELALVSTREGAQHRPEYVAINPKSKVPALDRGDGGPVLTELPAIAMWLGATNRATRLWPDGADAQARCLEMLDYIAGTVHPQAFTRQFRPGNFAADEADQPRVVEQGKQMANKYLALIDAQWRGGEWVLPGGYSVADAGLFYIEYWATRRCGLTLPPRLSAHLSRMLGRPAVQRALEQEGLAA